MSDRMRNVRRTALWLVALIAAVLCTAFVTVRSTRPAPPDLGNAATWMLIKKDAHKNTEVRVYVVERVSSTWDPHDVAQNKIVVTSNTTDHEFRWPDNIDFAGGWCEIVHGQDGAIAVVLFGNENVVRVVAFINGRFVFRRKYDELVTDGALTYAATGLGGLAFEVRQADRRGDLWRWVSDSGFSKVSQPD